MAQVMMSQVEMEEELDERAMVHSCQVIVASRRFDALMALVIVCNCFALAADTYDATDDWHW